MSTVYGNCIECGAFPINDETELCEACEEEARHAGEFDDVLADVLADGDA